MTLHLGLIATLAKKDIELFFADRRGALLAFLVPVVLASAFGLIFARPAQSPSAVQLPLLVIVEDDGEFARRFVEELGGNPRVQLEVAKRSEAMAKLADRRPGVALVLPNGFEALKHWKPGVPATLQTVEILHHPLCANEAQWAEGIATEQLARFIAGEHASTWLGKDRFALPFAIETTEARSSDANFNAYSHSFSGMTLQYLLFWGMESGLLLLRDRRRSVWSRLRAAPVPLWCLLLGKATSTATPAFLKILSTFGFGYVVFGVAVAGSWLGFLALAVAVSMLAASTGLLVAAIGGTEARARSMSILVILGVCLLGGLWLPSFVLPGWVRDLALSLPTTWAMRGFDATTWQARGWLAALPSVAVVAGFTAVFLGFAVARLFTLEARRRRGLA